VALLDAATKRLADLHTEVHTWQQAAQEFFAQLEDGRRWDRAQATFSLQSVPSDERVGVLTIAEFDVPEHVEGSPEHVRSLVTRYERGIAEYGDDAQLVARPAAGIAGPGRSPR
jgi:hypothetical protein